MDKTSHIPGLGLMIWVMSPILSGSVIAAPSLQQVRVIRGNLQPKSINHNGNGLFFVQNMMYRHSITVYDRSFELKQTISDKVRLSDFNFNKVHGTYQGAPVEVAFDSQGKWAWVSNYWVKGVGFDHPGQDNCRSPKRYDHSFVYKISTRSMRIEDAVAVGSVPKFLTVTPDDQSLIVSNWCSGTISIVPLHRSRATARTIKVGRHPRGIAVSPHSQTAYVSLMGASKIAEVDLNRGSVEYFPSGGRTPRHVVINPSGREIYVSLSEPGQVVKIDVNTQQVTARVRSGALTRGLALSPNRRHLYAANYRDNSIAKIDLRSFRVIERAPTPARPISLAVDEDSGHVWVACYSGSIAVFRDRDLPSNIDVRRPIIPRSVAQSEQQSQTGPYSSDDTTSESTSWTQWFTGQYEALAPSTQPDDIEDPSSTWTRDSRNGHDELRATGEAPESYRKRDPYPYRERSTSYQDDNLYPSQEGPASYREDDTRSPYPSEERQKYREDDTRSPYPSEERQKYREDDTAPLYPNRDRATSAPAYERRNRPRRESVPTRKSSGSWWFSSDSDPYDDTSMPPNRDRRQSSRQTFRDDSYSSTSDRYDDRHEPTRSPHRRSSYVIVSSFRRVENARRYASRLREQGFPAGIISSRDGHSRVYADVFSSRKEAQRRLPEYQSRVHRSAWILSREP